MTLEEIEKKLGTLALEVEALKQKPEPESKAGDVVYYGDKLPLDKSRVGILKKIKSQDGPSYFIDECWWYFIEHPVDLPGLYTRWKGGKNPVPGKRVTVWLRSGEIGTGISESWGWSYNANRDYTDYTEIIAYMVMPDA